MSAAGQPYETEATTIQHPRDGRADAFRRCFGLFVANVCIAQRHARPLVTEQSRDDRQRNGLQNRVAHERMTQIMQVQSKSLPPSTAPISTGWSDSCRVGVGARTRKVTAPFHGARIDRVNFPN